MFENVENESINRFEVQFRSEIINQEESHMLESLGISICYGSILEPSIVLESLYFVS